MPVEQVNKKGFRRLRFTRNTAYRGTDYGPDYPQQECDVDAASAFRFLGQARAVEVKPEPPALADRLVGQLQTRDPQAQHRDPVIATATEATPKPRAKKATDPK